MLICLRSVASKLCDIICHHQDQHSYDFYQHIAFMLQHGATLCLELDEPCDFSHFVDEINLTLVAI